MSEKFDSLDKTLKSHFSYKEDIPQGVKYALHTKLHQAALGGKHEKLGWLVMLVPCVVLALVAVFLAIEMLFGFSIAVILGAGYFFVATFGGATVLLVMMKTKPLEELS